MGDNSDRSRDPIGSLLVQEDASFVEIVQEFVEGLDDRLAKMEAAIRAGDLDALRTAAHQLKGGGGGYGYPILTDQAAVLEGNAKDGALEECRQTFKELEATCQRVVVSPDITES